jgi:predicted transcriptional regulator
MKVIWKETEATAKRVCEVLDQTAPRADAERGHHHSTISTYLERLRLKHFLDRRLLDGRQYAYFAILSREDAQRQMLRKLDGLFDSGEDLLLKFADASKLGRREKQELKRLAERLREKLE